MNTKTRYQQNEGITKDGLSATYVESQSAADPGGWELRDKSGAVIDWEVGPRDRALAWKLIDRNRSCWS